MCAVYSKGQSVSLTLSILDQSPINALETATDALQHTVALATQAEAWGYHRFWVSEHHGSERVMGSSPEVLIAHLLAKTSRIRLGSGGVMLQHDSPYKVAENFNVLATLAPGRVDWHWPGARGLAAFDQSPAAGAARAGHAVCGEAAATRAIPAQSP